MQSRTDEWATFLAETLQLSAEMGVDATVLFGGFLVLYVVGGFVVTTILNIGTPYPTLSLQGDPVLLVTSTFVGIFTLQGAGSLLLYQLFVETHESAASSVMRSLIAVGIGGALLEVTAPETWRLLISYI